MFSTDMRKFIDIVEARKVSDPDIEYIDDKDKVTVKLSGKKSGPITKLSNTYIKIRDLEKELKEEKAKLTPELKRTVNELFDAEDALKTKYIETVSNLLTITKDISASEKREFDYDGFFNEASELLEDTALKLLLDLKEKYTNIKQVSGRTGSLRDVKIKESENTGFLSNLNKWATDYASKIKKKISMFDKRYEKLKKKYGISKYT